MAAAFCTLSNIPREVLSSFLAAAPRQRKGQPVSVSISILVADDSDSIRRALRFYFNSHADFCVCGEAADGIEAIENTRRLKPDVVVLDFVMPRLNGLETARAIRSISPDLPVIMFTSHMSNALEEQARVAGIRSVLSKTDGLELLLKEIRKLAARDGAGNGNGKVRETSGGA